MAWFAMDCNIHTNPKVLALSQTLSLDVDAVIGKLSRLWAWAAQTENEDGDISHMPNSEIADLMRWKKKPAVLVDALKENGFIDMREDGLFIHDWSSLNGKMLSKKRHDRARKFHG